MAVSAEEGTRACKLEEDPVPGLLPDRSFSAFSSRLPLLVWWGYLMKDVRVLLNFLDLLELEPARERGTSGASMVAIAVG